MNKDQLKQLIRESFKRINEHDYRDSVTMEADNDREEESHTDPQCKWRDFCDLAADPGNRDFRVQVGKTLIDDPEILLSVLEALDDESHYELHDEIYRKVGINIGKS